MKLEDIKPTRFISLGEYLEPVWSFDDLSKSIEWFRMLGVRISGCDVYIIKENKIIPTGINCSFKDSYIMNGKCYKQIIRFAQGINSDSAERKKLYYSLSFRDSANQPIVYQQEYLVPSDYIIEINTISQIVFRDSVLDICVLDTDNSQRIIRFKDVYTFSLSSIDAGIQRLNPCFDNNTNTDVCIINCSLKVRDLVLDSTDKEITEYCVFEKGERLVFVISKRDRVEVL